MKKAVIFYFSGTGNTKIIAQLFRQEFENRAVDVKVIRIEDVLNKKLHVRPEKYDILGIGYPVHAFNAPRVVYDFIRILPAGNGKSIFTFKVAADFFINGGTTSMLRNRLRGKGYNVFHEDLFVISCNLVLKYPVKLVKQLYSTAVAKVKVAADEILSNTEKLQKNSIFLRAVSYIVSCFECIGTRFIKPHFRVSGACILCNRCVNACPQKNISNIKRKIKFGWNCVICMRCIYGCPKMAISIPPFNFAIIKGGYDIESDIKNAISDPDIKDDYVTVDTKGYYRRFYRYLK